MKPFNLEQMEYILAFLREAIDGIKKTHCNEEHFWGGEEWFDECVGCEAFYICYCLYSLMHDDAM